MGLKFLVIRIPWIVLLLQIHQKKTKGKLAAQSTPLERQACDATN